MVFRSKFKTVPGQQFLVRRAAYHRIQDAFAANGIAFAQQTVRITSDAKDETEAAAAAKAVTADQIVNIS